VACGHCHLQIHCDILSRTATHCNTLQHTATPCNTLQHPTTPYNTLQHPTTPCSTLQHTAAHCTTLQHTAPHCNTLQQRPASDMSPLPSIFTIVFPVTGPDMGWARAKSRVSSPISTNEAPRSAVGITCTTPTAFPVELVLQCVAVCHGVLQCVTVCCSVSRCAAVC